MSRESMDNQCSQASSGVTSADACVVRRCAIMPPGGGPGPNGASSTGYGIDCEGSRE